MELPRQREYALLLKQGAVYHALIEDVHPTIPHFFIVLNKNPKSDPWLYLLNFTTDFDRVLGLRKNELAETVVSVEPTEYDLRESSLVDCNEFSYVYKDQLPTMTNFKGCAAISPKLLERLITGIKTSRLHSPDKVKTVTG